MLMYQLTVTLYSGKIFDNKSQSKTKINTKINIKSKFLLRCRTRSIVNVAISKGRVDKKSLRNQITLTFAS